MEQGIFISYRRDDSRHASGRLVERLAQTFDRDQLFMDVDAIDPGHDFLKVINEKVAACQVMLVIIGRRWLDARNEAGHRRLDDANDFMRLEIEAALKRDIRVIPVLVDGATMPREDQLPPSMAPLARRHAVQLSHESFGSDAAQLADTLRKSVDVSGGWWSRMVRPSADPVIVAGDGSPRQSESPSKLSKWEFAWTEFVIGAVLGGFIWLGAFAGTLQGIFPKGPSDSFVILGLHISGFVALLVLAIATPFLLLAAAFFLAARGSASRSRVFAVALLFGGACGIAFVPLYWLNTFAASKVGIPLSLVGLVPVTITILVVLVRSLTGSFR